MASVKQDSKKQYRYGIWENDTKIYSGDIDDPFIHSIVRSQTKGKRNWGLIWNLLLGRPLIYTFWVDGSAAAYRVVFDSDYSYESYPEGLEMRDEPTQGQCRVQTVRRVDEHN
jgi:hypothetical protein